MRGRQPARAAAPDASDRLKGLFTQRTKLLALPYADKISADQFGDEADRITIEIENLESETTATATAIQRMQTDDLTMKFEKLTKLLDETDVQTL
ncbi:MAG: hypothetical protein KDB04_06580 [Acidimicrobiales bacterium]|nr:hypothetical protein [Acidimicrobiales bacterium]